MDTFYDHLVRNKADAAITWLESKGFQPHDIKVTDIRNGLVTEEDLEKIIFEKDKKDNSYVRPLFQAKKTLRSIQRDISSISQSETNIVKYTDNECIKFSDICGARQEKRTLSDVAKTRDSYAHASTVLDFSKMDITERDLHDIKTIVERAAKHDEITRSVFIVNLSQNSLQATKESWRGVLELCKYAEYVVITVNILASSDARSFYVDASQDKDQQSIFKKLIWIPKVWVDSTTLGTFFPNGDSELLSDIEAAHGHYYEMTSQIQNKNFVRYVPDDERNWTVEIDRYQQWIADTKSDVLIVILNSVTEDLCKVMVEELFEKSCGEKFQNMSDYEYFSRESMTPPYRCFMVRQQTKTKRYTVICTDAKNLTQARSSDIFMKSVTECQPCYSIAWSL